MTDSRESENADGVPNNRHSGSGPPEVPRVGEVIDETSQVPVEGPVVKAKRRPLTHRQQMQKGITVACLIFVGVVISAGVVRWFLDPTVDLEPYTANLLAPVIGIVATIVGYFFGVTSKERKKRKK